MLEEHQKSHGDFMRPIGGHEMLIATLPCSQATHTATASMSLLPGIDAASATINSWNVLSPASESSCDFFVASSKNPPPGGSARRRRRSERASG
jgi:hypothetical protein